MKKIILLILLFNSLLKAEINGFFRYQFGYENANNGTVVSGAESLNERINMKSSEIAGFLNFSNFWLGHFGFKLYSTNGFLPNQLYSKNDTDKETVVNNIAIYIGKWLGKKPQVKLEKYEISSGYKVLSNSYIYDENNNRLLSTDDRFDLVTKINKISLIWGEDARLSNKVKGFVGHIGLNYYYINATYAEEKNFGTYIKTGNFNSFGIEMSARYGSMFYGPMFSSIGCFVELAGPDMLMLKSGYFINIGYCKNSSLKFIIALQGNMLDDLDISTDGTEETEFAGVSSDGFDSYTILGGVSYSF